MSHPEVVKEIEKEFHRLHIRFPEVAVETKLRYARLYVKHMAQFETNEFLNGFNKAHS